MYTVIELEDSHECETCGGDWASGYQIYKDSVLMKERKPYAYCWGSKSYERDLALYDILNLEGIKVESKMFQYMIPKDEYKED